MLAKATALPADEVFLDLEDSVAPGQKQAARVAVAEALRRGGFGAPHVGVRINGVATEWWQDDLAAAVGSGAGPDFVTVPKVQGPDEVALVDSVLGRSGAGRDGRPPIGIQVLIESSRGLANVEAIAAASPRLQALIFGPADMAASLGMPALSAGGLMPGYPGDHFHYAKSRILLAARAAGLRAIDGPHLAVDDLDGCREGALRARALGFDGMWVVHPSQIEIVNEAFTPTRDEYERAVEILAAYERATTEGVGAVRLGAEMIDEASRKMAEGLVARGRDAWGDAAT